MGSEQVGVVVGGPEGSEGSRVRVELHKRTAHGATQAIALETLLRSQYLHLRTQGKGVCISVHVCTYHSIVFLCASTRHLENMALFLGFDTQIYNITRISDSAVEN